MPLNKKKPPGGLGRLVQAATPTLTEALTKAGEAYNQNERAWHKRNTEYQITRGSQRRRVPSPYGKALRQAEAAVVEKLEELIASGQVVYGQYRRPVSGDPGDDRFLMAAEFGGLAFPAAGLEMVIQSLEALKARDRNQKVPAGVADQALDLAKVGVVGSNPIARSIIQLISLHSRNSGPYAFGMYRQNAARTGVFARAKSVQSVSARFAGAPS